MVHVRLEGPSLLVGGPDNSDTDLRQPWIARWPAGCSASPWSLRARAGRAVVWSGGPGCGTPPGGALCSTAS
ncbi:hypothetical protein [Paractinoplanes maris]|uniref:hypothetical protein n=1 Tax=Paractinoplanes maris TaxID=1734446 RepID=UPI00202188CC|nr:hypothetical protein [Actinoplanes maris]